MAKISFHKIDEMFEMVSWTPYKENFLFDLLNDFKENEKHNHSGLQGEVMIEITSQLSTFLGKAIKVKKVEKKVKALSARYDLWEKVRNWPSVKLNFDGKFETSNATWDDIIKQYPYAKKYKHQPEPLWIRLDIIFGQLKRKEERRRTIEFIEGIDKLLAPQTIATVDDDDGYVKDEQSGVGRNYIHSLPLSAPSVFDPSFRIKWGFVGTSGAKRPRFDDDELSQFSLVGSCMGP